MADDPRAEEQDALSGPSTTRTSGPDELDRATENVLEGWPTSPAREPSPTAPDDRDAEGDERRQLGSSVVA